MSQNQKQNAGRGRRRPQRVNNNNRMIGRKNNKDNDTPLNIKKTSTTDDKALQDARRATTPDQLNKRRAAQARGGDARDPTVTTTPRVVSQDADQERVIRTNVPVAFAALEGIPIAVLSECYTQGFQQSCDADAKPWAPYAASLFLVKVLEKAVQGQNINLLKGPRWLKVLVDSLLPHKVPFKTAEMAYSWDYTPNTTNYVAVQAMAPYSTTPNRIYNYYYPAGGPQIDGWDSLGGNTTTPDESQQLTGFNLMCTYMSSRAGVSQRMWETVDFTKNTKFARNGSAFAYCSRLMGSGQGDVGFWEGVAYNEVPITHPIFACFAGISDVRRGFKQVRATAGDSIYLGHRLCTVQSEKELRTKCPLQAKPVDFFFCAQVLFACLAKAFQYYYDDQAVASPKLVNFGMSIQDALILLRQALMGSFAATQPGVQGIVYRAESTQISQPFRPFLAGPGTCALGNVQMQAPLLFVENIRLLQSRRMVANINPQTGQPDNGSPTYLLPVLGGSPSVRLDVNSYTYKDSDGVEHPIFLPYPNEYIELTTGIANSGYVALNTSQKLQAVSQLYNEVYATLSRYMMSSAIIDAEPGIGALEVISMSRMLQVEQEMTHPHVVVRNGSIAITKTRLEEGEDRGYTICTSQQPLNKSAYQGLQSWLIIPEFQTYNNEAPTGVVSSQVIRTYMCEPYAKPLSSVQGTTAIALSRRNLVERYTTICVAPWGTKENDITKVFETLLEQGHGGFLTDLTSAFTPVLSAIAPVAGQFIGGAAMGMMARSAPRKKMIGKQTIQ